MQNGNLRIRTPFRFPTCAGYFPSQVTFTRPLLDYPKLEDIFEELDITALFQGVNQNLKLIKEGVLNIITGNTLSPAQKDCIFLEGKTRPDKVKELNSFLLFQEEEDLSSTAGILKSSN